MNDTQQMLKMLNEGFPKIAEMNPIQARNEVDARVRPAANMDDAVSEDHEITVDSQSVPIRVYRPLEGEKSVDLVTVYAHGGGFLHGSIASHDSFCRRWVRETGATVISVGYRLAPEWGAPAPAQDMLAALRWVHDEEIGKNVILAGDSSGANVALVASLMCKQTGLPPVQGMVLLYPFLDPTRSYPSHGTYAEGYFIGEDENKTYWDIYLGAPGAAEAPDWQINPLLADSFADCPPSVVVTAGQDSLQDEGRAAYERLVADGVDAIFHYFPDQFHGFMTIPGYRPAEASQQVLWSSISKMFLKEG